METFNYLVMSKGIILTSAQEIMTVSIVVNKKKQCRFVGKSVHRLDDKIEKRFRRWGSFMYRIIVLPTLNRKCSINELIVLHSKTPSIGILLNIFRRYLTMSHSLAANPTTFCYLLLRVLKKSHLFVWYPGRSAYICGDSVSWDGTSGHDSSVVGRATRCCSRRFAHLPCQRHL